MGMESFFINLKVKKKANVHLILQILEESGYVITTSIPFKKSISFRLKHHVNNQVTSINRIIVVNYSEFNLTLSLQACFSCFDNAKDIIVDVAKQLASNGIVEFAYYGDKTIDPKDFSALDRFISDCTKEKRLLFINRYGSLNVNLLPNDFFDYVNKHNL